MSVPEQLSPSYEELSGLVTGLMTRVEALEVENVELKRRLGMNSLNSSTPPSKDSIAAKAQRQAQRSSREQRADRKPGGQKGRKGSGLTPTPEPDRTELVDPPAECSGCGADLADGADAGVNWAQVWDIPPIVMAKVHYLLPRRRCGCCGKTITASAPHAQAGAVVYGPNVNAAAILLGSEGNVPVERTAMLMQALLGMPVTSAMVLCWHRGLVRRHLHRRPSTRNRDFRHPQAGPFDGGYEMQEEFVNTASGDALRCPSLPGAGAKQEQRLFWNLPELLSTAGDGPVMGRGFSISAGQQIV